MSCHRVTAARESIIENQIENRGSAAAPRARVRRRLSVTVARDRQAREAGSSPRARQETRGARNVVGGATTMFAPSEMVSRAAEVATTEQGDGSGEGGARRAAGKRARRVWRELRSANARLRYAPPRCRVVIAEGYVRSCSRMGVGMREVARPERRATKFRDSACPDPARKPHDKITTV